MSWNSVVGMADDAWRYGIGLFNRPKNYLPFDKANPDAFFNELHAGNPLAREAMKKYGYGPFMGNATLQGAAEAELREMGTGFPGASGYIFGRPMKGLGGALGRMKGIGVFAVGFGAFQAATAPRGHKASGFVKGVAGTLAFSVGDVIGSMVGGPLAGFALGYVTGEMGEKLGDAFQMFTEFNRRIKHINMGGNYEDTRMAFTMRQRAAAELGSSVMNARMYLGKEGSLFHQ